MIIVTDTDCISLYYMQVHTIAWHYTFFKLYQSNQNVFIFDVFPFRHYMAWYDMLCYDLV